jgi:transcription elongation factor GreA
MEKEKLLEKLNLLFKEELWGRIEPKDIGISKFKILDDLFNSLVSASLFAETLESCKNHLKEHGDSVTASYLIGLIGYHTNRLEDTFYLKRLIDLFLDNHKWAVAERIAEKILEYGENRIALRAIAISLERLGRNRDAIPVWESMLKIDRFDAEVAKKLAFAIIDDDPEKSIQYMKLSIEGFIKNGEYDEIANLWNKLVSVYWEDMAFFERIERMLVDARQLDLTAALLKTLLNMYRDKDDPERSIEILKKILQYTPDDNSSRRELVKFYEKRYGQNSQFQQFLKLSKLNNFKYPAKHAIHDFENYIVFDKGNYAYHRSWGVGKIVEIDSEKVHIDFKEKAGHQMSIQMALQSLNPISSDHLYVMEYEDFDTVKDMFKDDFRHFFEILIKSYSSSITLANIKKELIPKYIDAKSWSKWWNKTRTEIKRDPHFGFSEKKKDLVFMRDKPVTFGEELLSNMTNAESFSEKLDVAIEFVNNIDAGEGASLSQYFIDYFTREVKVGSPTKQILSYFILRGLSKFVDARKLKLEPIRAKIIEFMEQSHELPIISIKISSYDYKKDFINLIEESRKDWPQVVAEILFETPLRIHKYIMNNLIRENSYNIINNFIDKVIPGAKQYPEIFIWVAKNIFTKTWDYDWLDYSREALLLTFFRLMNELKKIETKGNRLKNMTIDILFDNDMAVLNEIVEYGDEAFMKKVYDLFGSVSYINESHLEKFYSLIIEKYSDFKDTGQSSMEEEWEVDIEKLIVSREGYDRMMSEFNRMVNVEMVNLTKELSKVSDVSGDVRENVEYNALMEKQTILKMTINKLEDEIKRAEILELDGVSTESINIGTNVIFEDIDNGEKGNYIILGPWDADFGKRILSYRSPIAKALLGKRVDDEIDVRIGDDRRRFKVLSIEKYSE